MTAQCNKVGEELIDAWQKANLQGAHKRWKNVRQALKGVLDRDKIQDLYDRLKQYREQNVAILLFITSAKQTVIEENVQAVKQNVTESETRNLDESRQIRFQILDAIQRSNYNPNTRQDMITVW